MRMLAACLLLAACVTGQSTTPSARVAGCWIVRGHTHTTTLRWTPDALAQETFHGVLARTEADGIPEVARYRLEQLVTISSDRSGRSSTTFEWMLCAAELHRHGQEQCRRVVEGRGGSLEIFIDQHGERLRIAVIDPEGR